MEIFLRKLKFFSFKTFTEHKKYLNANRWKELVLKYLSNLEKFYFYYSVYNDKHRYPDLYKKHVKKLISSFWIERKWIYEIKIDFDEIIYSIHPYE